MLAGKEPPEKIQSVYSPKAWSWSYRICFNVGSDASAWLSHVIPCRMCSTPCTKVPKLPRKFAIKSADTSDTQMKFVSWFYRTIALWNTNAATEKHRSWKSDTPCSARNSRLAESARFSDVFHDLAAKANLEAWQNHGVPRRIVVGDGGAELCWLQWDYWPYTNH